MDGNLKLILGMIWTLVLRFTIADIKYDVSLESAVFCDEKTNRICTLTQVKKASPLRKACCFGVNGKLRRIRKSMSKTSPLAGLTDLRCSFTTYRTGLG
jgi:hypothetical protein